MPKFTVVKQRVFIVEASNDAEAHNIVTNELSTGQRQDSEEAFFAAEYSKIYSYGEGDAITSLAMEYEPTRGEARRVTGYVESKEVVE